MSDSFQQCHKFEFETSSSKYHTRGLFLRSWSWWVTYQSQSQHVSILHMQYPQQNKKTKQKN